MRLRRSYLLAYILLLSICCTASADRIDDFVRSEMDRQHLPGVSIVVIKDQKTVKVQGYGLANIELKVAASPDTVYKIGSVSKQFIAAGIMLLVNDGKVRLDDPVSTYLEGTPESWSPITVRHLLTHTSGIVREAPGFDPLKIQADADVIKTAYNLPLRFQPGEKWEYCNVGYFSLAEIIRRVSGKPWGEFLNERLFTPLGMSSTRTTDMTALVPNRANGYVWREGKFQNASVYLALRPSGAFLSTVRDLAKWDAALNKLQVFKQTALDEMWTPAKLNDGKTHPYGFGWELDTIAGHKNVHHGGSLPGFRSQFARFVDDKVTVAVLTNGDNANAELIALGVANFYISGLLPVRTIATVNPKMFDTFVGQYKPDPSSTVLVSKDGDKLMFQLGLNGEKRQLLPETETSFFLKENPRNTYTFVKDASGQEFLTLSVDGREVYRAKKVQ